MGNSSLRGACQHSTHVTGRDWGVLLQLVIFLPLQTILHPHNVGPPHDAIRILFILTAPKVWRRGQRGHSISPNGKGPIQSQILDRCHEPIGKDAKRHTPIH